MVETDGLVQLPTQVVDEPQRKESLSIAGVQTHTVLQVTNRLLELPQLTACMGQISQNRFPDPERTIGVTFLQGHLLASLGFSIVLLLIVDDSQLGVDQRVIRVDFPSFLQGESSCLQIVGAEVFHAHVEMSLRTSREQTHNGSIDGHGLIGFILHGEGVSHADPGKEEAFIENDGFLEVLPCDLELLAVEVVGTNCEPANRMRGVVFNQIMSTVVEFTGQAEVEEAGCVDGQDLEAEGVFLDGFETEFVGCWDAVVLVECLGLDAQDVDVLPGNQRLEHVVPSNFLPRHGPTPIADILDLRLKDLSDPLILACKDQPFQQLDLLRARNQLTIDQPVEGLDIRRILHHTILVILHSFHLVLLSLVALPRNESPTTLHLLITICMIQLQLQGSQTLIILFVHEKSPSNKQLETDVMSHQFILLEQGMHLLEVTIAEVAFSEEIDHCDVGVGESDQFVGEEDGICVVMDVEVVDGQLVETSEHLVAQDLGGERVQLLEVVFWVGAVVWLQEFCEEEDPVRFGWGEDSWFALAHQIQNNI